MAQSSAAPVKQRCPPRAVAIVLIPLGLAVLAMTALHGVQPELNPIAQPVSFYVWGRYGWLLPAALGAFGAAVLALSRTSAAAWPAGPRHVLTLVGATLLLTAAIPSDRWFPWEQAPTPAGLVHAAAGMVAPTLLVWPMATSSRRATRVRRGLLWIVAIFVAALLASAGSLLLGLWRLGPPPWIGLLERVLALAAVVWVSAIAGQTRCPR